jgi:pimeloyl-ACP methyl ester carboxylesterase
MKLEVVRIPGAERELAGLRYLPEGRERSTALILAHGFTSGKHSMDLLASYLAGRGYEGLTFDFVGHKLGGTGGAMERTEQAAENFRDALAWMRTQTQAERVVLIGHSMGAAAALQMAAWEQKANASPPVVGLICLCMGLHPARGFDSQIGQAMLAQRSDYVAGTPPLELLQGIDRLLESARELGDLPILLIAAKQDVLLSVERVEALAERIGSNASVTTLESTHLEAPDRARGMIANWLEHREKKDV